MTHPFVIAATQELGTKYVLTDTQKMMRYTHGIRFGSGSALAVVQPGSLVQMWRMAQLCVAHDLILITQASNTGLTGGSTPDGEYDRPVVVMSTTRIKGIQLINDAQQAVALPGASLYELEDLLKAHGRDPHSVIGSSCIGASIIGGICNNSGGALIQRGPAYTELALFAQLTESGELVLKNHLGIRLGREPEEILRRLEEQDYTAADIENEGKLASDHEYHKRVREVDEDTPSRFNNDERRLFEASGSAGRLIVFAVRVDTFKKPKREQVFYIGTNDTQHLTQIRRDILRHFKSLPVSGEYIHRRCYEIADHYGKDVFLIISKLGSKYIPKFFALKSHIDRVVGSIKWLPQFPSDRLAQAISNLLPKHLPAFMQDYHQKYEHHLILKMADEGIEEAQIYLDTFFQHHQGAYHRCSPEEGAAAGLHRFAAAGAANRLCAIKHKEVGDIVALDIALRRNDQDWFEQLPPELDAQIAEKLYYGHFFCHVLHQDYILKKGVNPDKVKKQLLALLDQRGAQYPAEHNVGHLYLAKSALKAFYRCCDPTNSLNPGIGKTSRWKYWVEQSEN